MKEIRTDIMGMPITVELVGDTQKHADALRTTFEYFASIDARFSTYKSDSEISWINRSNVNQSDWSDDMLEVIRLANLTKEETNGYFDIKSPDGFIDPSGMVKGWAIHTASKKLRDQGIIYFYIEAGGDIETSGCNAHGDAWTIGIKNPFNTQEIVKRVRIENRGIATSGNYIRGAHIYDPHTARAPEGNLVSISVIGPNVYEADRFATAAFAMGDEGISFIESLEGCEGYAITTCGRAIFTSNFNYYVV